MLVSRQQINYNWKLECGGKNMQLTFDNAIKAKIAPYLQKGAKILLDFDDGIGPFVDHAIACSIGISYRIIIIDENDDSKDYQEIIKSNLGVIYSKKYANYTLADDLKLSIKPPFNTWQLSGDGMLIDDGVQLITKFFKEVDNVKR